MTTRVSVEPELLSWACDRAGVDIPALSGRFPKLPEWLAGTARPTFKQLEQFAKRTHTPFGYLLLSSPPDEPLPLADFRSKAGAPGRAPSANLLDTVYTMQRRQGWLREHLVEDEADPLDFVQSASLKDSPVEIGREMRRIVSLEDGWPMAVPTWQQAVGELRRAIEALGVITVINGVVGNNTQRPLDVDEFRGFAISDRHAPLIFVNGADTKSAQMFTLAHELAHLWLGQGGVTAFDRGFKPVGHDVETWCNRAAAEFLVPAVIVKRRWPEVRSADDRYGRLARIFKVSPIVAARRLWDLKLIGRDDFFAFYEAYRNRELAKPSTRGGDFYNNQNTRVGQVFARHVIRAALEGRIGFKEAYDLTDLRGGTFQEYAARLGIDL